MKSNNAFPVGWALSSGEERLMTLPLSTVLRHQLITGSSGWGKSGAILSMVLQALTKFPSIGVVLTDCKGETAHALTEEFLPSLVAQCPRLDPAKFVIVKPFGRQYVVPLNPLVPIPGLDASVQAHIVATLLAGLADGTVGPRMKSLLAKLCHAGILAGVTLLVLLSALHDEAAAARLASRVPDEELRHYLTEVLPREPRASKDALASRLEWLLLIPEVRAMLNAPTALSGADILEAPLSVIDLGGDIPMGFLPLVEVMASLIMTIVTMAIFSRKVPAHPVLCIIDEWQVIAPKSGAELERTLAQARFRQVSLMLANQTLGQIADTSLLRSLLTNISVHWAFRPTEKDVEHVLPLLPITGRCLDPERPDQFLGKDAERKRLIERLSKLPPRQALLSDLVAGRADLIRTLAVPYAEAKRRSDATPAAVREACRRGRFGVPFGELQKQSERVTHHSAAAKDAPVGVQPPITSPRSARPRLVLP